MRKSNQGFTLIELIMVIVILGVLSAFALPRFANFSGDARAAALQGMAGGMKSAAAIAHAQWLISNGALDLTTVTLDGTSIAIGDGYPTVAGIIEAIGGDSSLGQFTVDATKTITPRVDALLGTADTAASETWYVGSTSCFITFTEASQANGTGPGNAVTSYTVTIPADLSTAC